MLSAFCLISVKASSTLMVILSMSVTYVLFSTRDSTLSDNILNATLVDSTNPSYSSLKECTDCIIPSAVCSTLEILLFTKSISSLNLYCVTLDSISSSFISSCAFACSNLSSTALVLLICSYIFLLFFLICEPHLISVLGY